MTRLPRTKTFLSCDKGLDEKFDNISVCIAEYEIGKIIKRDSILYQLTDIEKRFEPFSNSEEAYVKKWFEEGTHYISFLIDELKKAEPCTINLRSFSSSIYNCLMNLI